MRDERTLEEKGDERQKQEKKRRRKRRGEEEKTERNSVFTRFLVLSLRKGLMMVYMA